MPKALKSLPDDKNSNDHQCNRIHKGGKRGQSEPAKGRGPACLNNHKGAVTPKASKSRLAFSSPVEWEWEWECAMVSFLIYYYF
ncbi:hypothetical protein T636_A1392 [Enterobacter hormaechei subsp. xiangfangensis]|nr:hypothetical protein T636_A1392 [Enterobacter hormaechei subsp. xiangfangensis]